MPWAFSLGGLRLCVGWKSLMVVGDPSFGASPRTVNAMTTGIPGNSTGWAQLLLLDELNGLRFIESVMFTVARRL